MSNFTRTNITILVFALLALETKALIDLKTATKRYDFTNRVLSVNEADIEGPILAYAVCEDTPLKSEMNCTISLTTANAQDQDKSCDVTLRIEDPRSADAAATTIRVAQLTSSKAMMLWLEKNENPTKYYARFTIVDFNGCGVKEAKMPIGVFDEENILFNPTSQFFNMVVVYKSSFDFVFINTKLCGDKYCKASFDFDGKKIAEPVAWYPSVKEEVSLLPVEDHSADKGLLMMRLNIETKHVEVSLIEANGPKVLMQKTIENSLFPHWDINLATGHDTITVCLWVRSNSTCTQYDLNGKQIFQNSMQFNHSLITITMHNLPGGGYLMFTASCEDSKSSCDAGEDYYALTKVDAQTKQVGITDLKGLNCLASNNELKVKFYENDSKQICLSLACSSKTDNVWHLDFISKCFDSNL